MSTESGKPEWKHSESPAIEQLKKLGYEYKSQKELHSERESRYDVLLPKRFKTAIRQINKPWLSEDDAQDVLRQLRIFGTNSPLEANEIAYARLTGISRGNLKPITIEQDRGDGRRPFTIKLIDFDNISNNDFLVTNQFKLLGHKDDIFPDVVLFVNGIPLVVIECKSPEISHPISEAINNNLKRYQMRNTGFEQLFYFNQILVACCGTKAKYAPTFGEAHHYMDWKDPHPLTTEQVNEKFGDNREQEILIAGMFEPTNFINLMRNFVVYDEAENKRVKKIAKYQQFRAVNKTIQKIEAGNTPNEKGGVIWHTQRSGKSLTMVWLAQQLKRKFGNPTVLVVTDRRQLDKQIHGTFKNCGFPDPIKASGRDNLKSLIENNRGKTIMTTIQKFPFFKDKQPHAISDEHVFVLIDEGHRTQYGLTAADMRMALPNGVFFAYTGTPLMKKEKTTNIFGDYIDKYKLSEAEADGAVVPIYYSNKFPHLSVDGGDTIDTVFDRIFKDKDPETKAKIRKQYANKTAIAESPDRIKKIAIEIVDDFEKRIKPNGFKAMIVAASRKAAVRYKEILDDMNVGECAIIMSESEIDKKYGWDKYWLTDSDRQNYAEKFKKPMDEEPLSILIVVDMLLTGFDAPILQVMYLDQGLKEHALLQAIARVSTPYGETKTRGYIIDYWDNSQNLRNAFELYDDKDIENSVKPLDDQSNLLKLRYEQAMSYFKDVEHSNMKEIMEILTPEDVRTRFENDFKTFSKEMDAVLPDPEAAKYRTDLSFMARVRAYAKSMFYDEDIELKGYGEKVKKLIDESVRAGEISGQIPPTKIEPSKFKDVIEEFAGTNKTKASAIDNAATKTIAKEKPKNPAFYRSLKLRLEEIVQDLKNKNYQDSKKFNELLELWDTILSEDKKSKSLGFKEIEQFSVFNSLEQQFGLEKSKGLTLKIHPEIKALKVIDWDKPEKENIQKEMRNKVKDVLAETGLEFERINELAKEIIDVYKARENE